MQEEPPGRQEERAPPLFGRLRRRVQGVHQALQTNKVTQVSRFRTGNLSGN